MSEEYEKDVHTEHCCREHGCKYGDKDCPVTNGRKPQSYPCETCDEEYRDFWEAPDPPHQKDNTNYQ